MHDRQQELLPLEWPALTNLTYLSCNPSEVSLVVWVVLRAERITMFLIVVSAIPNPTG